VYKIKNYSKKHPAEKPAGRMDEGERKTPKTLINKGLQATTRTRDMESRQTTNTIPLFSLTNL